jgi:hypothetical protein
LKLYRGLPVFVWVLLGLLGISAGLLSLGQSDDRSSPSANSFGPSGVSALAKLLEENGYSVRVSTEGEYRPAPDETAILLPLKGSQSSTQKRFLKDFPDLLAKGGRAIVLPIPVDFLAASRRLLKASPQTVSVRGGGKFLLFADGQGPAFSNLSGGPEDNDSSLIRDEDVSIGLWDANDVSFLKAAQIGQGKLLQVGSGTFATNRFIDKEDDAEACLNLVSLLTPPKGKVIFVEAAFGNVTHPSLAELIGPWAAAGWQQFLFLLVVVIFTHGIRFGIPDESRPIQSGTRELLDAITDTYHRGKHVKAVLMAANHRILRDATNSFSIPSELSDAEKEKSYPPEVNGSLQRIRASLEADSLPSPEEALKIISETTPKPRCIRFSKSRFRNVQHIG